jgi:hypothetical protein
MRWALGFFVVFLASCAMKDRPRVAAPPSVRSTPDFLDLRKSIVLKVENAYWAEGADKKGLEGYIGTQSARASTMPNGNLNVIPAGSTTKTALPRDQPPVEQLLPTGMRRQRFYRFYFAVTFARASRPNLPVLLYGRSMAEVEQLTARLKTAPDEVCGSKATHCTVFPSTCTVSVEMEIIVNGEPKIVSWGSTVTNVTGGRLATRVERTIEGTSRKLENVNLRTPLQPGDRIMWE